jgi:hypothetical protein
VLGTAKEPCRRIDACQILSQRRTTDLDLGASIAEIAKAADLVLQKSDIVARVVIPATGVDGDGGGGAAHFASGDTIRQELVKWQVCDLRGSVPDSHIESADCNAALAVATRLFAGHHDLQRTERVEVCPCGIHDIDVASSQQARCEPLADQTALREAAN